MKPSFHLKQAAHLLRMGAVIAYPNEGVFGFGCNPMNGHAVERILQLKQRPAAKGLILVGDSLSRLLPWLGHCSAEQRAMLKASGQRPISWIVEHNGRLSALITGGRDTVAVRISAHPIARQLIKLADMPLVSTSANRSGRRPLVSAVQVQAAFGGELDAVVRGRVLQPNRVSQIRRLDSGEIVRA